jgi:hypothetical protein
VWFVYYRVLSSHLDRAVLAVQQQQQQLRGAHPGLQATLMRRSDPQPVHTTLMEVYVAPDADGQGPDLALAEAIEAAVAPALAGLLQGERHREGFVPCA